MSETPQPPASKRDALLALLDRGMVMMHLDARREGVSVPQHLAREAHLRLNLSYRFLLDDLLIDDAGVAATLSFGGQPRHCRVPWLALFAVTRAGTEEGWLWPNDLPPELLQTGVDAAEVGTAPTTLTPHRPAQLRAVALDEVPGDDPSAPVAAVAEDVNGDNEGAEPPARPPPFLRLVK